MIVKLKSLAKVAKALGVGVARPSEADGRKRDDLMK